MNHAIEVDSLSHNYGDRVIYENLSFSVPTRKVVALLGKNGVGKTTLIRILMGFLRPSGGQCKVLGEASHKLTAANRERIGLLFEGHLTYDLMTIEEIERFYRPFYSNWRSELYYDLVDRLKLPNSHRICNMSCGQRSQVVLGLIFAQSPELMILDDYSMGLDAGYRRLFLEYLDNFIGEGDKTVFITSHVVQDMEDLVDEVIFLQRGGKILQMPLDEFRTKFRCHSFEMEASSKTPSSDQLITNVDIHERRPVIYSFASKDQLSEHLSVHWPGVKLMHDIPMSLEDAFIGLTGKY